MNTRPATAPAPRRISWTRVLLVSGAMLLTLVAGTWAWLRSYKTISVARDTTYLTAPLAADGYPDYVRYLNELNAAGVAPAENAWIVLLREHGLTDLDPQDRVKQWAMLRVPPEPLDPRGFQLFLSTKDQASPDELARSSRVGRTTLIERFARQIGQNAFKRCLLAEDKYAGTALITLEHVTNYLAPYIAEGSIQVATDPETAEERAWEEENSYLTFFPVEESESVLIPDLSEEALKAAMPREMTDPELVTPSAEEIADWRREQFNNARQALYDREDRIVHDRPWSREECPLAAAWLDAQSANLDRIVRDLAARPKFYMPYIADNDTPQLYTLQLANVQCLRSLSQALQLRARQAIHRGDFAAARRDIEAQLMLSRLVPQQPILVELLSAYGLHKLAIETLRDLVLQPNVTEPELAALAKLLEQPLVTLNMVPSLELDRLAAIDYVVATSARGQEGSIVGNDMYWERTIVCWDDVLRRYNELHDEAIAAVKADDWAALEQLQIKIKTEPANYAELEKAYAVRSWSLLPSQRTAVMKYALPNLFLVPICNIAPITRRVTTRHDAARTMIALARYRLANNAYPAALAALVPRYLGAVPTDPFVQQPLTYKQTPDGYRAYAFGMNELDDGGEPGLDADDDLDSMRGDLVFGAPGELPRKLNLAW